MSEVDPDKIRDIEDRLKYLEDCQEALCKHLNITMAEEIVIKEKGTLGFSSKEESK